MRLRGKSSSAIFWLNTSFGGGKTHALIALLHAVKSPASDAISEFVDASLLPGERVRLAIFDGQNADISSGHSIGDGIRARTPWGEIAYGLAGRDGYRRVDDNIGGSSPGADTLKELIGDRPALILLDELAVYLRKAEMHKGAGKQFVAFLTALIKAVEGSPNAALVYTLAAGSEDGDAYRDENRTLMDELESVSARKAELLNPTEEGETIQILRRRLFERRDESQVDAVVDAYRRVWKANRDKLPDVADLQKTVDEFKAGYPLHPDILNTLISKTSTLENFQRVRGMLRILGYVVHDLWERRNSLKPTAIHLHHFDMGNEKIRLEITTKLKQETFASAIDTDIACDDVNKTSLAQRLDRKHYPNTPFTTYLTRVVFMNTLAFNQQLKGVDVRHLRYSILWPGMELGYIGEALARFRENSLYLNDNPEKPTQFQAVPNLGQAIKRAEQNFDDQDLEDEIDQRVETTFRNGEFELVLFPDGHEDVQDETNTPELIIPKYSQVAASNPESPPGMVDDIFRYKSIGKGIRIYRNNLVFLVASKNGIDAMYEAARRHLAMAKLAAPYSMASFADYQRNIIQDKQKSSDSALDDAILKCYKFAYYPDAGSRLGYTTMDWRRGGGQRSLVGILRDMQKIRTREDMPDNPESLVDRIAKFKKNGEITTLDFRGEFYKDPALPILIGDEVFSAGILHGIEGGLFVYKRGELVCGKDDPQCKIVVDSDSVVYTISKARKLGIWPHKEKTDKGEKNVPPPSPPKFNLSSVQVTDKPSLAVKNVLDDLHKHDIDRITKMRIESKGDVFLLLIVVGRIKEIKVRLVMAGEYKTGTGGRLDIEFTGTLKDSEPVQEFLKSHLPNASISSMTATLNVDFKDGIDVGWLEKLAEHLQLVDNDMTVSGIEGASK